MSEMQSDPAVNVPAVTNAEAALRIVQDVMNVSTEQDDMRDGKMLNEVLQTPAVAAGHEEDGRRSPDKKSLEGAEALIGFKDANLSSLPAPECDAKTTGSVGTGNESAEEEDEMVIWDGSPKNPIGVATQTLSEEERDREEFGPIEGWKDDNGNWLIAKPVETMCIASVGYTSDGWDWEESDPNQTLKLTQTRKLVGKHWVSFFSDQQISYEDLFSFTNERREAAGGEKFEEFFYEFVRYRNEQFVKTRSYAAINYIEEHDKLIAYCFLQKYDAWLKHFDDSALGSCPVEVLFPSLLTVPTLDLVEAMPEDRHKIIPRFSPWEFLMSTPTRERYCALLPGITFEVIGEEGEEARVEGFVIGDVLLIDDHWFAVIGFVVYDLMAVNDWNKRDAATECLMLMVRIDLLPPLDEGVKIEPSAPALLWEKLHDEQPDGSSALKVWSYKDADEQPDFAYVWDVPLKQAEIAAVVTGLYLHLVHVNCEPLERVLIKRNSAWATPETLSNLARPLSPASQSPRPSPRVKILPKSSVKGKASKAKRKLDTNEAGPPSKKTKKSSSTKRVGVASETTAEKKKAKKERVDTEADTESFESDDNAIVEGKSRSNPHNNKDFHPVHGTENDQATVTSIDALRLLSSNIQNLVAQVSTLSICVSISVLT